jgi:superfamily II DNA or RNA helicase
MNNLFKHQERILELNPERLLVNHSTGTGKSRTCIELAYQNCSSFLFICPKALKENSRREIEKWRNGRNASWMVISKEEFRRDWDKLERFEGVIVDEVHAFLGMKSQMMKSLLGYFKKHNTKYRWLATATCYLSSAWNIYVAARLLGHEWGYMKFKQKFFYDVRFGNRILPIQREGIEHEIAQLVKIIGDTVSMDEIVDIPDQVFETEYIKLTSKQSAMIKSIPDILPIVRLTKEHQIAQGILIGDEYNEDKIFECDKDERIMELLEEFKRVAIFCRYNIQIDKIKKMVEDEYEGTKDVFVIRGDVKNRDEIIQKVNKSDNYVIIINIACGEGYEIVNTDLVIFASLDFSIKSLLQAQGRFLRINRLKKNLYIYLISGEIDAAVKESLDKKEDFHIEIYAKNNYAKLKH